MSVGLGFRRARLQHVYSILRGKDLETGEFSTERRDRQFEVLKATQADVLDLQNWHEFFKAVLRAGYRSTSMISSNMGLLYSYVLFLVGKRDLRLAADGLRDVIARWFFMVQLTGRYTGSPETVMEQDLGRLDQVTTAEQFVALLDKIVEDGLTDDFWSVTLPNDLATSAARSPSLFAYCAALNLLGARVLFSRLKVAELFDPAVRAKRAALERHHLFPKGYLKSIGITRTRDINQIANLAFLEWPDNAAISDEPPSQYFRRYAHRLTEEDRYWHALPEGWHDMDYQEFLEARRRLMARVVRDGFERLTSTAGGPMR